MNYGMYHAVWTMTEQGPGGIVINMCSVSGLIATPGLFSYSTAKAAAAMMTRAGNLELAEYGNCVIGIAPGGIETSTRDASNYANAYPNHVRGEWIQPVGVASTAVSSLKAPRARSMEPLSKSRTATRRSNSPTSRGSNDPAPHPVHLHF